MEKGEGPSQGKKRKETDFKQSESQLDEVLRINKHLFEVVHELQETITCYTSI